MQTTILKPNKKNISKTAKHIKEGGVVAFATETVYGLGANALIQNSVEQIYKIKGRPNDNPLIVHLHSPKEIKKIAHIDKRAKRAIKKFMPGALTLILNKKDVVAPAVTCGLNTIAVRVPKNKTAKRLLRACKVPVAAPSANSSTKPSPTQASHVYDDLNGKISYILDGGTCSIGVESAIIDLSTDKIRLLRKGGLSKERLEKALGKIDTSSSQSPNSPPISPGLKYAHYAPKATVLTFNYGDISTLKILKEQNEGKKTVILCLSRLEGATVFKNPRQYAKRLFFEFRQADKSNTQVIICELSPEKGIGGAINNRLLKASSPNKKEDEHER